MKHHLIVIEGTDGCGKSTQCELTARTLEALGVDFKRLRFPRYENESSALLRMYLRGDFGKHPEDVNAYAASTFFAVDRYASFRTDWKADYEAGRVIFSDRYTTSNAVHQSSKLEESQLKSFTDWLFSYEYDLLGLPRPSCVIFLDLPPELSFAMLEKRQGEKGDIHELDHAYLCESYSRAKKLCIEQGWHRIPCDRGGKIRSAEEIQREIEAVIREELSELLPRKGEQA